MPERTPYLAANWKMNKTIAESGQFLDEFLPVVEAGGREIVICPSLLGLATVVARCEGTEVRAAAQNMHFESNGAFTGEVSAVMLAEAGATGVILGHSERRQLFGETDEALARKVPAALAAGLEPILCCGETEGERDSAQTEHVLSRQIVADLAGIEVADLDRVVIAYEPIWAIGTGRTATAEQAQEAALHIRNLVRRIDPEAADRVRILYGGSVKPANAAEILAEPDIDGALVGGASLAAADFAAIAAAAG